MSKPLLFTFPASLPSSTSLMADLTYGRCYAERSTGILLSPAVKRALWARHLALPVIRLVMGDGVDDLTRLATQRRRIWREGWAAYRCSRLPRLQPWLWVEFTLSNLLHE
uniref:Uncharacterized protein n=1 Tax=Triticum urartu TaxID=4572 RepID=A0A8R7UV77_TRIUA